MTFFKKILCAEEGVRDGTVRRRLLANKGRLRTCCPGRSSCATSPILEVVNIFWWRAFSRRGTQLWNGRSKVPDHGHDGPRERLAQNFTRTVALEQGPAAGRGKWHGLHALLAIRYLYLPLSDALPTPHPQRRTFSHFRYADKVALFFVCCVIGWVRDLGRGSPGRLEDAPLQCTAPVLAAEPMFEGTHKAHNDPENWISAAAHAKDLQAAAKPGTYVKLFLMIRHGEGEKDGINAPGLL